MMRLFRLGVSVAVSLMVLTAAVEAQGRQGFWIGFGLGGGVNTSQGLDDARRGGGAGYLRLGGTITPQVMLGAEALGWGRSERGATIARGNTTFMGLLYPSPTGGFFLKGGAGIATVGVTADILGTTVTSTENGFGTTVGLGVDARLGNNLYLTPNLDFLFQAFEGGRTNTLVLFTLGLTWH
jgi:hypothetical protein